MQGLTLELIVIHIGDVEFAAGLPYVVLTRVRKITDLVFNIYEDKERSDKIRGSKSNKAKNWIFKSFTSKSNR